MQLLNYFIPVMYAIGLVAILLIYLPFSPMTIDLVNFSRATQINIYLNRRVFWAIGAVCLGAVMVSALLGVAAQDWLWITAVTIAVLGIMFWSGYVPYVMTPPEDQQLLDLAQADRLLGPDSAVLGLYHKGIARAYPRDFIARPHYFTDNVAGDPLTISYCILCNSGVAFKSELDKRPLHLQCVTAYNNNIIYCDPDSGNFIQQLDGAVIHGPDKGKKLESLALMITTWKQWKSLHPETNLYYAPARTLRDRMVAAMLQMMIPIDRLSRRSKPWHRVKGSLDHRLPAMAFVFGVEIGGDRCAFPVSLLRRKKVQNSVVGNRAIAIFYDPQKDAGMVYSSEIDGVPLDFAACSGPKEEFRATDKRTGSVWDLNGVAQEGPLTGRTLTTVPHYNQIFWFSWALFKPGTRLSAAA